MNSEQKKILIVDDSQINIMVLTAGLKNDYDLKSAKSGEEAFEILDSGFMPDVMLLDIIMLEMDGYEVCKRVKENEKTKDIKVVFLSAISGQEDQSKGLELGALEFITKPLRLPQIKERLSFYLS